MRWEFFSYVLHPFVHIKNLSINFHDLICFQNFNKCLWRYGDSQEITEYILLNTTGLLSESIVKKFRGKMAGILSLTHAAK